jgi:hypothetical protein
MSAVTIGSTDGQPRKKGKVELGEPTQSTTESATGELTDETTSATIELIWKCRG